ncbi:MAG: AAA family ATPase [Candidatus Riflebacteria bacterium]|nr:AAA family ATPase [Candidatus Riflebacteria bacterium]
MKILTLRLQAYGPFTDTTLDLTKGDQGLHLIHGPNEAGKSCALRALRRALYGIEKNNTDNFLHAHQDLRIGLTLRHSSGRMLDLVRRKGNAKTLRGADGETILEESQLEAFLGSVDQELFVRMFGIDHEQLATGGEELRQVSDIGQILFSAGSGIVHLRQIQQRLKDEMEELFLPRGTRRINRALKDLQEAQHLVKQRGLSADEWGAHDRALRDALSARERLTGELSEIERELSRLTRIRAALPAISRRKTALAQLETCPNVPLVDPGFDGRRQKQETTLAVAQGQEKQTQGELEQVLDQLAAIEVPEPLLARAEMVEKLKEDLGAQRKARSDRPGLIARRQTLEHGGREIMKNLGRVPDLSQIDLLRLEVSKKNRIRVLTDARPGLDKDLQYLQKTLDDLQRSIGDKETERAALPDSMDPSGLAAAVLRVQQHGDLGKQPEDLSADLRTARSRETLALRKLPLWSGTAQELEGLPLPPEATLTRFETDLGAARTECSGLEKQIEEEERAIAKLDREIEKLARGQEIPTEDSLVAARSRRQQGWGLVCSTWRDRADQAAAVKRFVAGTEGGHDLTRAYERCVERADDLADRLRREADRVAKKAERDGREQRRLDLSRRLDGARERALQGEKEWIELWKPLGIDPLPPREMVGWCRKHEELLSRMSEVRQLSTSVEQVQRAIDQCRQELEAALALVRQPAPPAGMSLAGLVDACQKIARQLDESCTRRKTLDNDLSKLRQDLRGASRKADQAKDRLSEWQKAWVEATAWLGTGRALTPKDASDYLEAIAELFQKFGEADVLRRRLEGMDRDREEFVAAVNRAVEELAPDLAREEPDRAVEQLNARLKAARSLAQQRKSLVERQDGLEGTLRKARKDLELARITLDAMCQEAGCARHDELKAAAERSATRRRWQEELDRTCDDLLHIGAGQSIDELVAQADGVDGDTLAARIAELEGSRSERQELLMQEGEKIGTEQRSLGALGGSAAATEAADQAESLMAQIETDAREYAVLCLARAALLRSIERYREKSQGPVVSRASAVFRDLTGGSFQGLKVDYDEKGNPILLGVRGGTAGREVGLEGLSDGTRDQLYLALRLASLELYLGVHEPVPFIVDDILVNFDDARAVAAIGALRALARKTQVIVFTHHEHIRRLASQTVPDGELFVHDLPSPTGA